uniref:Ig-like domain-containing protein n=1 Tax=Sphenodon punctatus TaxID=8508 RepID=A0A8D0HQG2_SPHPU
PLIFYCYFLFYCVPEAEVTWFMNKIKLTPGYHLHDGSLLIANVVPSDVGLYSCRAANLHGEVTENTELLILDPPRALLRLDDLAALLSVMGLDIPSVLSSPSGTSLVLSPGSSVLVGCPVDGVPTPNITWFYTGQPINLRHHILAAGRILQILNISDSYQGEFSCLAQNEAGSLLQRTSLTIQGRLHRTQDNCAFRLQSLQDYMEDWKHLPHSLEQCLSPKKASKHTELLDRGLWSALEGQFMDSVYSYLWELWLPVQASGVCACPH